MEAFLYFFVGVVSTVSYGAIMASMLDDYRSGVMNFRETLAIGTVFTIGFATFVIFLMMGIAT
jgi:hypothetical protein